MKRLCGYTLPENRLTKITHLKGKPKYKTAYMRLLRRYVRGRWQYFNSYNDKRTKVNTTRMVGKYETTYIVFISYCRGLVGMGWVRYDRTQDYYPQLAQAQKIAYSKTNYPN